MRYHALMLILFALPCWGQSSTGNAQTSGPCSPAITGSNINVYLPNCQAKIVEKAPPTPPPTIIQVAPSYGNLRERTIAVSQQIQRLVQHRKEQFLNETVYPRPLTPERYQVWLQSNDNEYRSCCDESVKEIHDEFTTLHITDDYLNEMLKRDADDEQYRMLPQNNPLHKIGLLSILKMQAIGEQLAVLANDLDRSQSEFEHRN